MYPKYIRGGQFGNEARTKFNKTFEYPATDYGWNVSSFTNELYAGSFYDLHMGPFPYQYDNTLDQFIE
jgi:hypothetical protein